jgi:hypothetical protein
MTTVTDVFGAQSNGVALVSDFLIKPTVQSDALIRYHVQYGQILDFPTDDGGYIRAANVTRPVHPLLLCAEYRNMLRCDSPDIPIRIDAEPYWEHDPRLIILRARKEGVMVATFSAELASRRIHYTTIPCRCGPSTNSPEVNVSERWQAATVCQILNETGSRVSVGNDVRVYVGTGGDVMAQLTCACLLECRQIGIALACLVCAYHKTMERRKGESLVIVS